MTRALLLSLSFLSSCAHAGAFEVPAELVRGTLEAGGRTRTFLAWKAPSAGAPLVLNLHGRLGDGANQQQLSGMLAVAKREGFTLVLPDGVGKSWHDARGVGPAAKEAVDDVAFLSALIEHFVSQGADRKRVYVLGMSNGGFMTLALVCRLADKLAGAASITGSLSTKQQADCPMARPVPVAFFMGTKDPLVPFGGGQVAFNRGEITSADAAAAFFAKRNGCAAAPAVTKLPDVDPNDGTTVELREHGECAAPVRLYAFEGGGHTWPGGWSYGRERVIGKTSRDLSASETAWAFLKRFSLP